MKKLLGPTLIAAALALIPQPAFAWQNNNFGVGTGFNWYGGNNYLYPLWYNGSPLTGAVIFPLTPVRHNVIPYFIYPDQAAMYAHPPEVPVIGPEGSSSSPANGTANPKETPMSAPLLPTSMPYSFSAPFRYYQPVYEGTGGYIYGR